MGNITDYVIGYGRYTIEEEPFNEVDSLVLSQFSYLKFDKILTGSGRVKKAMRIWELKESGDYETRIVRGNGGKQEILVRKALRSCEHCGSTVGDTVFGHHLHV